VYCGRKSRPFDPETVLPAASPSATLAATGPLNRALKPETGDFQAGKQQMGTEAGIGRIKKNWNWRLEDWMGAGGEEQQQNGDGPEGSQ
jgi:hypothetical protein